MQSHHLNGQFVQKSERFAGHVAATIAGLVIALIGLAMGVTMVLLPIGLPLGLAGLCLFLWGIFVLPTSAPRRVKAPVEDSSESGL